jgi:hypothetical protein
MRIPELNKRIENLSGKLVDEPKEHIAKFDFDSLTDAEKALFNRIEELQKEYGKPLPKQILEANKDLIFKAQEIILKYTSDTFRFTMLCFLGDPDSKVDQLFFNVLFYKFRKKLMTCLKNIRELPQSIREDYDFMSNKATDEFFDIKQDSVDFTPYKNSEYTEDEDNEHYDPDFYRN